MNKNLIADIVIYGGALGIILWAILKSIGVINTPTWIEMLPYLLGGASFLGVAYKFGEFKKEIELNIKDLKVKVEHLIKIEERFSKLENEHNLCLQGKLNLH